MLEWHRADHHWVTRYSVYARSIINYKYSFQDRWKGKNNTLDLTGIFSPLKRKEAEGAMESGSKGEEDAGGGVRSVLLEEEAIAAGSAEEIMQIITK